MQRVRIGITGLAVVFLLVLLAGALVGALHRDRSLIARTGNSAAPVETPKEPLAELGVAPGNAPPSPGEGGKPVPPAASASSARSR